MKRFKILAIIFALNLVVGLTASVVTANPGMPTHSGVIADTQTSGPYTYMEIEEKGEKFWIAGPPNDIAKGSDVSFIEEVWMGNFYSKGLGRTFDKILFVRQVFEGSEIVKAAPPKKAPVSTEPLSDEVAGTFTVAEVFAKKAELNAKIVLVKGKVVKVSPFIMGRIWVHIQDGTGEAGTNDLVFRATSNTVVAGDEVTAKGRIFADKDFGGGYFYAAIAEDSTFTKK
ncbi:MAG: hypothetical protein KAT46_01035 [Deltaproteobacteria bacterium]|nr:hypothetical protein [Deltaproteobacteria bacterium]